METKNKEKSIMEQPNVPESLITSIDSPADTDLYDQKYSILYGYTLDQFEYERKRVDSLVVDSIQTHIFRLGYGKAMRRVYPDSWKDVFNRAVERGNDGARRETQEFKKAVAKALDELEKMDERDIYDRFLTRFEVRYLDRMETIAKVRPILQPHIRSGRMLNYAQTLVTYFLDYQWNAEREGRQDFYCGYRDIMSTLPFFKNKLDITKVMPFIVADFRADSAGTDLNHVPIFQCVSKASNKIENNHRSDKATVYRLNDNFRFLLDIG